MFGVMNMSVLMFMSDRELLLAMIMSLPKHNQWPSATLPGIAVLHINNRLMRIYDGDITSVIKYY